MAFKNLVEEAKKNTPKKIFRRDDEIQNLIDCTGATPIYVSSETKTSWENCRFLKNVGNQNFCKEFLCMCSKEKCNRAKK
jgi:hypothetical protein